MNKQEILDRLRENERALRERGVTHAALFGSRARGDDGPYSDTDIMIDIDPETEMSVYDYVGLKRYIAGLLRRPCRRGEPRRAETSTSVLLRRPMQSMPSKRSNPKAYLFHIRDNITLARQLRRRLRLRAVPRQPACILWRHPRTRDHFRSVAAIARRAEGASSRNSLAGRGRGRKRLSARLRGRAAA